MEYPGIVQNIHPWELGLSLAKAQAQHKLNQAEHNPSCAEFF
jgi:hypothetical protein